VASDTCLIDSDAGNEQRLGARLPVVAPASNRQGFNRRSVSVDSQVAAVSDVAARGRFRKRRRSRNATGDEPSDAVSAAG
jgi:hypothetical protein